MASRLGILLKKLFLQGTSEAMAEANRPIVRGYLALAGTYYSVMVPLLFFVLSGLHQIIMVSASLAAAIVAFAGGWMARKQVSSIRLEQIGAAANLLVYLSLIHI